MTPDLDQRLTALLAPLQPETVDTILVRLLTFVGDIALLTRVLLEDGATPAAVLDTVSACTEAFIADLTVAVLELELPFVS